MVSAYIPFFASLGYALPSLFLYGLTIYVIKRYSAFFNSSFFTLYAYDGVMNVFTYFIGFVMMRLTSITCYDCPLASFYSKLGDYIPLNIFTTMSYHMAYVQYTTTMLISLNRLSVLYDYKFTENIWRKYTWLIMALVFIVPFADTHRLFYYTTEAKYDEESDSFIFYTPTPLNDPFKFLIPAMSVISVSAVVINMISFISLRHLKTVKKKKAENNLISIMCITCAVQFLGCILSALRVYSTNSKLSITLAGFLPYVSDGLTLVQPWLLVFLSSFMRDKIKQMWGIQQSSQGAVVVVRSVTS